MHARRLVLSSRESNQMLRTESYVPSQKSVFQHTKTLLKQSEAPSIHSRIRPNQSTPNLLETSPMMDNFLSPTPKRGKILSNSFFAKRLQNKYDQMIAASPETVAQLKNAAYKETTLYQILQRIAYVIGELHHYKSEKALECQVEKQLDSHVRFQEVDWIFKGGRLREWSNVEALFRRVLMQFTTGQDGKLQMKKNMRPDSQFLGVLQDFSEKMEDLFRKLCEDSYRGFCSSIKSEREKLLNKEVEVMHQFARQNKKDSYYQLQSILKSKFQMNLRVMESKILNRLNTYEEKYGNFKQVTMNNRFISNKIDDLLQELN